MEFKEFTNPEEKDYDITSSLVKPKELKRHQEKTK